LISVLLTVCNVIAALLGIFYAYRLVFGVVGVFRTKRYPAAVKQHQYAVVIAARNEERVIGNLLDSIACQDYPAELVTVFVVADNCDDKTAEIARSKGAVCYERKDPHRRTKGYALEFLFEKIEADYGIESFEAYLMFDADNLLQPDYISRMNDAFDSGERVVLSYRNTKNLGDGWISAGYALHWIRTCRLEHCGRSVLGVSGRIQGTGFLFASDIVSDGWHYTSLTEDRAFSSDLVARGITISYQHEAEFFDEQPTSLRIAWRQRLRWAKGHLQAFAETGKKLFLGCFSQKGFAKRFSCFDMLLLNFPSVVISAPVKLLEAALTAVLFFTVGNGGAWWILLYQMCSILIFEHFGCIPLGLLVFFLERNRMHRLRGYQYLIYSLLFPVFTIIGDLVTLVALFVPVTWKPIPHKVDVGIDSIEKKTSAPLQKKEKDVSSKL